MKWMAPTQTTTNVQIYNVTDNSSMHEPNGAVLHQTSTKFPLPTKTILDSALSSIASYISTRKTIQLY